MIDGVRFAKHVVLAAVGIGRRGEKHVLGLRKGATENAVSCKALLADLIERGLPAERTLLFVIDGGKALDKAVSDVFGERALMQRFREHKKRNVTEALPERMRASVRSAMNRLRDARFQACPPPAREPGSRSGVRLSECGSFGARGPGRNAHGDAAGAAGEPRTGALLDQLDRESLQSSP